MAQPNQKQYHLEVTRYTLRAVRTTGSIVEFCGECVLDQKTALNETLAAWNGGVSVRAVVAIAPRQSYWHLSNREEAARHRSEADLRAFATALSHGFTGPVELIACHADDGALVARTGNAPWLLGLASREALAAPITAITERRVDISRMESATLGRVGAIATASQLAGGGRVVIWDLGVDRSQLLLVTDRGVEGVSNCSIGYDKLFASIQSVLGLKLRGAASRLFFNESYDFRASAPRIVADLAPAWKAAVTALQGAESAAFTCCGFTPKQRWFVQEMARAAGLEPWTPDVAKIVAQFQLEVAPPIAATLTPDSLGVLHLAAAHIKRSPIWHPAWTRRSPETSVAPVSALASAETKRPSAPPGEKIPESPAPVKAVTVMAGTPRRAPVGTAPTDLAQPRTAVAPAAANVVQPAAAVAVVPEIKTNPETAQPVLPPPRPQPKVEPQAAPKIEFIPPRKPAPPPPAAAKPAAPRRGYSLPLGIAAALLASVLAGKFYFEARSAKAAVVQEKAVAARKVNDAEMRIHDFEAQAKAAADEVRKEADEARENAVALARQQAEEQTRQQIAAELDADRIAKSPGILIVTTSPAGAEVSIDGGEARQSPLSLNHMLAGVHRVAIALAGYKSVELDAKIEANKTTDLGLIQLERTTGTLIVTSTPEQLDFIIREAGVSAETAPGRDGHTPAQFEDMPPGDYVVTFTQAGWPDQNEKVTVRKSETSQVATNFVGGTVVLTSVPGRATVKRDGMVVGTTPLSLTNLPPQQVNYEISLPDYEVTHVTGEVMAGKILKLNANFLNLGRLASASEIKTPPAPYETSTLRLGSPQSGYPAEVKVSLVVRRDGTTGEIQTVGAVEKDLANRCVEAVAKWKFHPAVGHDGEPINARVTLPVKIAPGNP